MLPPVPVFQRKDAKRGTNSRRIGREALVCGREKAVYRYNSGWSAVSGKAVGEKGRSRQCASTPVPSDLCNRLAESRNANRRSNGLDGAYQNRDDIDLL